MECVRALSGCILPTTSSCIPTAGAGDEACLKSSAITHLHYGLGDGKVCLWDFKEAWGGASLVCGCPGNWLWCCCALLLLHLLWGCELLIRESPLGHLATSYLLLSAEGDLAQDEEWTHVHLPPRQGPGCPHCTTEHSPYQALVQFLVQLGHELVLVPVG